MPKASFVESASAASSKSRRPKVGRISHMTRITTPVLHLSLLKVLRKIDPDSVATKPLCREKSSLDMAKPSFDIVIPLEDDAALTADIHLRAMAEDVLTNAQFPNSQAWEYFREWLARNTREHIRHSGKGVLIARDPATGDIASFIKWLEYGPGGEDTLAPRTAVVKDEWPEFCGRSILDEYANIAGDIRRRVLGQKGYFRKFPFFSFSSSSSSSFDLDTVFGMVKDT